jgi:hypothetical protein
MWKAAYYRKQAQTFLMVARLTQDRKKAARYALLASQYLEKAERITAETMMLPAE